MWLRKLRDAPPTDDEMARYIPWGHGEDRSFSHGQGFVRTEWGVVETVLRLEGSSKDTPSTPST